MNKRLVIIRGLPGSGKTTIAKKFTDFLHYEADMFFTAEDGTYRYDRERISDAHAWCFSNVRDAVSDGLDVVVSNTFTLRKEIAPYYKLGRAADYHIWLIHAQGRFLNSHGVPPEVIGKMRSRWEKVDPYFFDNFVTI